MSDKLDKRIDQLVGKVMKESTLETPSFDFTSKVMQHVVATSKSKATVYEPLISKRVWFVIFTCVLVLVVFVTLNGNTQNNDLFSSINANIISKLKFSNPLLGFTLPSTTMYAIVMLLVMLFVQLPILKNYFDKRFQ